MNILQAGLKQKKSWEADEALKMFDIYKKVGHRWLKISSELEGRSENQVKNFFYSLGIFRNRGKLWLCMQMKEI